MEQHSVRSITNLQYAAMINELSYKTICQMIGITPQQFTDWVKKRRPVPKERLKALLEIFKMDASLFVDENNYLADLTPDTKIALEILFLQQSIERAEEHHDVEAYQYKLQKLLKDKEKQHLITRFTTLLKDDDDQVLSICRTFISEMETGNREKLKSAFNRKEEHP